VPPVSRSSFERIGLSPDAEADYFRSFETLFGQNNPRTDLLTTRSDPPHARRKQTNRPSLMTTPRGDNTETHNARCENPARTGHSSEIFVTPAKSVVVGLDTTDAVADLGERTSASGASRHVSMGTAVDQVEDDSNYLDLP
jgi:hypothetical protein